MKGAKENRAMLQSVYKLPKLPKKIVFHAKVFARKNFISRSET